MLFALDAILNTASLTEAARKSHISQPAMSVALKKLRGIFDDDLVVYGGGADSRYTALAIELGPRVRQILNATQELVDMSPQFDPASERGTARLVMPDVIESFLLPPLVSRIRNIAPSMHVASKVFSYQPVASLFHQPLDIAIVGEAFASSDFASERLFSETFSCMVCKDGPYADGISEADFLSGAHIGISYTSEQLLHPVAQKLQKLRERQTIVASVSSYVALPSCIIGTDLIATTLSSYARQCAATMPVVVLPVPLEAPTINFVAQWQRYRAKEPGLQWLIEQLRAVATEHAALSVPAP